MFCRLLSFLHISFYRQKVNHLPAVLYIRRVLSIDQEFLCRGGFCQHSTGIDKTFTIFRVIAIKAPRFWDTGAFFMSHRSNRADLAHTAADPAEFSNIRGHSSDKVRVPFLSLPTFCHFHRSSYRILFDQAEKCYVVDGKREISLLLRKFVLVPTLCMFNRKRWNIWKSANDSNKRLISERTVRMNKIRVIRANGVFGSRRSNFSWNN